MTDIEKNSLMDNVIAEMKLSADDVANITGGYTQIMPNCEHQLVLLFGYDEKRNSRQKKLLLHDRQEVYDVYEALEYFMQIKKGKLRPRLSRSKTLEPKAPAEDVDDMFGLNQSDNIFS